MAASFHARSNSLPSRPHPLVAQISDHLCRLRDSKATSTSSSSIGNNLVSLQDLHDSIDRVLLLPLARVVLAQEQNRQQVDEVLDGSLRLLDLCNTIKDALLQTKDCMQELQSAVRRRHGGIDCMIRKYISSRKILKKTVRKVLKNLKSNKLSAFSSSLINEDPEILKLMKDSQDITLTAFESLLCFISEPESRTVGWSFVSKLIMLHKRVACEEQHANVSEFAEVDAALESHVGSKTSNSDDLQKKLYNLELCIQDLEDDIECLFRRMIKTRASFLNIFN